MGLTFAELLAIIASLVTISAGIARIIRYLRDREQRRPEILWGTIIAVILIVTLSALIARQVPLTVNGSQGISLGLSTATDTAINPVVHNTPTPKPLPLTDGAYQLNNIEFGCNGCDVPIRLFLTMANVDTNLGNVTLTLKMTNSSGSNVDSVSMRLFSLSDLNNQSHTGAGRWDNYHSIPLGESITDTETLSFVPLAHTPYSISVNLYFPYLSTTPEGSVDMSTSSFTFAP